MGVWGIFPTTIKDDDVVVVVQHNRLYHDDLAFASRSSDNVVCRLASKNFRKNYINTMMNMKVLRLLVILVAALNSVVLSFVHSSCHQRARIAKHAVLWKSNGNGVKDDSACDSTKDTNDPSVAPSQQQQQQQRLEAVTDNNNNNKKEDEVGFEEKMNGMLDRQFFNPENVPEDSPLRWFADLVQNDYATAEALYASFFIAGMVLIGQELVRMQFYGDQYVPFQKLGNGVLF